MGTLVDSRPECVSIMIKLDLRSLTHASTGVGPVSAPHYLFVQISQAVENRLQNVLESPGRSSWPDHL